MKTHSISSAIENLLDDFFLVQKNTDGISGLYDTVIREAEYAVVKKALRLTDRNKRKSAQLLGISRNTLNAKIKALKLGD
jgi:DNA-binding protein Fis